MPIVTKKQPDALQMYMRAAYLNERFPKGFRRPPTGKHADGRDRHPLMLEKLLQRVDPNYSPPRRYESKRGAERRAKGTPVGKEA